jgi:hypothetical protein
MLCAKFQLMASGGPAAQGHSDLRHIDVHFYKPRRAALKDARTDQYQCRVCSTRWERDYDPTEGVGFSAFRPASWIA